MSLIDITYFFGDTNLPGKTPAEGAINSFIAKYEPEYLQEALGYQFYKLFNEAITGETPDARWLDIKNGQEYNNKEGKLRKWQGLVNVTKTSPIADYIYFYYVRNLVQTTTEQGVTIGDLENATVVSPALKLTRAWNEMVDLTKSLHDFLVNKKYDAGTLIYPEFDICETSKGFSKINQLGI